MKKMFLIAIALLMLSGCIMSNTKLKLTDVNTGNSVTITDQGFGLDIKSLEKDGYKVEVIEEE